MILKVLSTIGAIIITVGACACNYARSATQSQAPITQLRVRLRCEPQLLILECRAFADDAISAPDGGDISDRVRWSSDTHAVVVEHGRIQAEEGGAAIVT